VAALSAEAVVDQSGIDSDQLARLVDLGILCPDESGGFSEGDVRRVLVARSLDGAGIPLDLVAAAIEQGTLSLDFCDAPSYERLTALASETFGQVSDRTGVPLDLLTAVREVTGFPEPAPDDRLREDEMAIVPFLQLQVSAQFRSVEIERLLRVYGDCTRRISEAEGAWWTAEVVAPALAAGKGSEDLTNAEFADRSAPLAEKAILAMYHAQQARAWTTNLIEGFESLLTQAGIHSRLERPPAICFLDITGYTRYTQERGDDEAANLAATVARLVQRISVHHGGKPIKWLGDGVMFHFPEPGPAVRAALQMVDSLAVTGMPPAHVGLHAGPVLFQEGDYFGQTVNIAARIADYARSAEVLVSQSVADACASTDMELQDVGDVELKGVSGLVHLYRAR
jgi:adenylate cyclase